MTGHSLPVQAAIRPPASKAAWGVVIDVIVAKGFSLTYAKWEERGRRDSVELRTCASVALLLIAAIIRSFPGRCQRFGSVLLSAVGSCFADS